MYRIWKGIKGLKTVFTAGLGLGLVVDELGILLYGLTYHNTVSYIGIIGAQALLFSLCLWFSNRYRLGWFSTG